MHYECAMSCDYNVLQASQVESRAAMEEVSGESETRPKKEQLTKTQKRKLFDRMGNTGEMIRGWNWVDIVSHLSQKGRMEPE